MYDTIIVGGGIAGLQAAIQLGRYQHQVLVLDMEDGRSTLCRSYHNVLGYPNGISGRELRVIGRKQAEMLGVLFAKAEVTSAKALTEEEGFELSSAAGGAWRAKTVLLATGVKDRFPEFPGLVACLGKSVYICPDCDGYETIGKRTIVMGAGNTGAKLAKVLTLWTQDLVYVNHEQKEIQAELRTELEDVGIRIVEEPIQVIMTVNDGDFQGVLLASGEKIEAERGFLGFGGNEVRTDLASQLGCERLESKHVMTDPRTKQTSVAKVWAAGDIGVHAEQLTLAMGEGAQAAIWIHKELMKGTSPIHAQT